MRAAEVRNLNWVPVKDWSNLPQTILDFFEHSYVGEEDIYNFVDSVFRHTARKLEIPYSELKPILEEENSAFYETCARLFRPYFKGTLRGLDPNDELLDNLKSLLRIPEVPKVSTLNVEKVLSDFSALTDAEKLEFFQRLGNISLKIDFSTN